MLIILLQNIFVIVLSHLLKIRRKTSKLLSKRSCLVKVFRIQRKSILFMFVFFLFIFYAFYELSLTEDIIVFLSFSPFIFKIFRLQRRTLLVFFRFLLPYNFISHNYFAREFSTTTQPINDNFLDLIGIDMNVVGYFFIDDVISFLEISTIL